MRPVGQVRKRRRGARVFSAGVGAFACALACNQLWGIDEPHDRVDGGPVGPAPTTRLDGALPPSFEASPSPPSGGGAWGHVREAGPAPPDAPTDAPADAPISGPCEGGPPVCRAGVTEPASEKCGDCDLGTKTRSRTCAVNGCGWSEWTAWSDCAGGTAECTPGTPGENTQKCGWCNMGSQTQTRTCGQDCKWSEWSPFGACVQGAECEGGTYRCCGTGSNWEWCYVSSCKWTRDCEACSGCGCP